MEKIRGGADLIKIGMIKSEDTDVFEFFKTVQIKAYE